MLYVGAKASTDQKVGKEYDAAAMLKGETVVHSPRASLDSLCWWLEIECGTSFSNLVAIFVLLSLLSLTPCLIQRAST